MVGILAGFLVSLLLSLRTTLRATLGVEDVNRFRLGIIGFGVEESPTLLRQLETGSR